MLEKYKICVNKFILKGLTQLKLLGGPRYTRKYCVRHCLPPNMIICLNHFSNIKVLASFEQNERDNCSIWFAKQLYEMRARKVRL